MQSFKRGLIISIVNTVIKFFTAFIFNVAGVDINSIIIGFIVGDAAALAMYLYFVMPGVRKPASSLHEMMPVPKYSLPLHGSSLPIYLSGTAIARVSSLIILFLLPTYSLKQIIGQLDYDRVALKTGLTGSMIMASVVFRFNVSVFYHYYYYPFSLLLGLLSYLFFLRYTRGVQAKDIKILNKILTRRAAWLTSVMQK
jgi:hypothetical protein